MSPTRLVRRPSTRLVLSRSGCQPGWVSGGGVRTRLSRCVLHGGVQRAVRHGVLLSRVLTLSSRFATRDLRRVIGRRRRVSLNYICGGVSVFLTTSVVIGRPFPNHRTMFRATCHTHGRRRHVYAQYNTVGRFSSSGLSHAVSLHRFGTFAARCRSLCLFNVYGGYRPGGDGTGGWPATLGGGRARAAGPLPPR